MKRASSAAIRPYRLTALAALTAALLSVPAPGGAAAAQQPEEVVVHVRTCRTCPEPYTNRPPASRS